MLGNKVQKRMFYPLKTCVCYYKVVVNCVVIEQIALILGLIQLYFVMPIFEHWIAWWSAHFRHVWEINPQTCPKKWNESGFRPPLCTYRLNWARRTPEDGEMIEMTLSSRHRVRNSSPGGLRPSTLPLGHGGSPQYWLSHVDGEETSLFLSSRRDREPNPELWLERQRC